MNEVTRKLVARKLVLSVAAAALYTASTLAIPALTASAFLAHTPHALAKDGGDDGGSSGSGSDGGGDNGGSSGSDGGGDDGGSSGSGSDGDNGGDDHSGSGSGDSDDDSDDDSSDDSSGRSVNSGHGGSSAERPEVEVTLTGDQLAGVRSGQFKLVDNLGRVLEIEVETEDGVTKISAKPHGGDARRNPGPITAINVVPAGSVSNSADDDGTPDQGSGDN
jgi:hypothetical protein